jgi:hypothetical protein
MRSFEIGFVPIHPLWCPVGHDRRHSADAQGAVNEEIQIDLKKCRGSTASAGENLTLDAASAVVG